MDWNRVEGNWKQVKGKVKEKWGQLTDDDLDAIAGKRDQLEGRSRSATASPRIKSAGMSTAGTRRSAGDPGRLGCGFRRSCGRQARRERGGPVGAVPSIVAGLVEDLRNRARVERSRQAITGESPA